MAAAFVVLLGRRSWVPWLGLAAVVALLLGESLSAVDAWSPYYKITAVRPPRTHGTVAVWGDNVPFQTIFPVATLHRIESFYFFPYQHLPRRALRDVLVIGAGTGNDVGVALSEGARHVDAVEIDPKLVQLGRRDNSEHAYQSPRVTVHVGDGRAFLQSSARRYSLILYALPDSLTALTGQAAPVGLENYLLTTQAVEVARDHLARGGVFAMYNYYQPFLLDRYATMVHDVFGSRPCVQLGNPLGGRRQAVITASRSGPVAHCTSARHGRSWAPSATTDPSPTSPRPRSRPSTCG